MEFVPNTILMGTATMEELSSTLATQVNDQDRYALAETIIVAQVALRDKLLEEQQTMIEKIRGLEEKMAAPRMDTVPSKNLEPSKFILRIPGITENYKTKKKIHGSWGKCLRAGFRTPVEGKRGRWGGWPPDWGQ